MDRRQFLRGSAVVAVAPLLPTLSSTNLLYLAKAPDWEITTAMVSTDASIPRLLQEGIHKVFQASLADFDAAPHKIFRFDSHG